MAGDEALAAFGEDGGVAHEPRETGGLERPAGAVVVLGVTLVDPVRVRANPSEVLAEPTRDGSVGGGCEGWGAAQGFDAEGDFGQVHGVDDADAAAGAAAFNRLRVEEIGIHLRRRINEPRLQVAHGGRGVAFLVGDFVSGAEDAEVARKTQEQLAVRDKVVGVGETIALDVGRFGIFWVWPPIITFGGKVMQPAGAAGVARGD